MDKQSQSRNILELDPLILTFLSLKNRESLRDWRKEAWKSKH